MSLELIQAPDTEAGTCDLEASAYDPEASNSEANMAWKQRGNCLGIDPDLFYPERGVSSANAKKVCKVCEVQLECLNYAIDNGEKFGIWGGMSERERRQVRRERRFAAMAGAEFGEDEDAKVVSLRS